MDDKELEKREWMSALADGQLHSDEIVQAVALLATSEDARAAWHSYHVLGDVLRCADLADCGRDRVFVARLRERLSQAEQPDLRVDSGRNEAVAMREPVLIRASAKATSPVDRPSANDATVRWKWLAAAASLAAVAILGWHAGQVSSDASARLAAASPALAPVTGVTATAAAEPPVMLRDPRLDELLAAHRQFGGTSALQAPAGFLRNATFEQPGR